MLHDAVMQNGLIPPFCSIRGYYVYRIMGGCCRVLSAPLEHRQLLMQKILGVGHLLRRLGFGKIGKTAKLHSRTNRLLGEITSGCAEFVNHLLVQSQRCI